MDNRIVESEEERRRLNALKDEAIRLAPKNHHPTEENIGIDLVNPTTGDKDTEPMMMGVVRMLMSLGFKVNPDDCSWKSITGVNGYFKIDILLVEPKTTAMVTSTPDSAKRHQLALDNYATTGKWIAPTAPRTAHEERSLGLRQAREVGAWNNVQTLDGAIKTKYAYSVSGSHASGVATPPVYGELVPGMDLALTVKQTIALMLRQAPRLALNWDKPPEES